MAWTLMARTDQQGVFHERQPLQAALARELRVFGDTTSCRVALLRTEGRPRPTWHGQSCGSDLGSTTVGGCRQLRPPRCLTAAAHPCDAAPMRTVQALLAIACLGGCGASTATERSAEHPRTDAVPAPVEATETAEASAPTEAPPSEATQEALADTPVVEAPTAASESSAPPAADPAAPPRVYFVDRFGGEAFVLLGTAPAFPVSAPRILHEDGVDGMTLAVAPDPAPPPRLTVVGARPCTDLRRDAVLIDRRMSRDLRDYDDGLTHRAVAIDDACAPALAIEGDMPSARLITFDFADGEFGEPSVGTSTDGWRARIAYAPSEDGICPGAPARVELTEPGGATHRLETNRWIWRFMALSAAGQVWVVIVDPTTYTVYRFPGPTLEAHREFPTGVDLAETCL